MKNQFAFLSAAIIVGLFPVWVSARPHHGRHPVAPRTAASPVALRLQPVSFDPAGDRASPNYEYAPGGIDRDRIPTSAADHFGRGGVASIGYEPGAARPLVGAHELNAAFSSQPTTFGGVVGGGVSLHF